MPFELPATAGEVQKSSFCFQGNVEAISCHFGLLGFQQSLVFSRGMGSHQLLSVGADACWDLLKTWGLLLGSSGIWDVYCDQAQLQIFDRALKSELIYAFRVNLCFQTGTMWVSVTLQDFHIIDIWIVFCFPVPVDPYRHKVHRYEATRITA